MNTSIATRLRELRLNRQLKQNQVANMIGVTKSTMSAYENGMRQPSYDILVKLTQIYHVSADYILGLSNAQVIDLSGLSEEGIYIVEKLVCLLSKK